MILGRSMPQFLNLYYMAEKEVKRCSRASIPGSLLETIYPRMTISEQVNMERRQFPGVSTLEKELQISDDCWEREN